MNEIIDKKSYNSLFIQIKQEIQTSQQKAISSVNKELIYLYFNIGNIVHQKQNSFGWGAKVIDRLSLDIKNEIPEIKGFSTRNIKRMLSFYKEYSKFEFVPPLVAQISWTHNTILIEKIKDIDVRFWYMKQTISNGWSKNILSMMIENSIHHRQGKITSNFKQILPSYESDLVQQSFKDPYIFDFLTIAEPFREKELELNLVKHMEKFLIELGSGFAFVGRQYKLEVADNEYYIDLLFYHLKLRAYVVIELKKGKFKPEYSGQVNFYCNVVNDKLSHKDDNPTIGLILCQEKNDVVAEYSLQSMNQPIGISEYSLMEALPKKFKSSLPSIKEIEQEFKGAEYE
jgi:predicted nuclease of restriction endonuclease-like (RecB) superfamily